MDFYNYTMDVYTHLQHTFMFKQLEKWILHPMIPLIMSWDLWALGSGDCFKCPLKLVLIKFYYISDDINLTFLRLRKTH